jgi:uncharacterized membrane protein
MPSPLTLSKSRIEALSDGVFSIAMTLLVLKLDVPEVMHHSSNEAMLGQLLAMTPAFMTYVVTFLVAGGFWYLHLTFHFIRHATPVFVWMNLVFLMLVALLPFSAGLMAHLLVHPVSQLFYFGNHLAIALLLNLQWHYAKWKGLNGDGDAAEESYLTLRAGATMVMFAACLVVSMIFPMWSWTPIPVVLVGVGMLKGWKRKKQGAA